VAEKNVELLEAVFDAISRKDLERFLELAHPEIEFHSLIAEADGRSFHGYDGVHEWWSSVIRSLDIQPRPAGIEGFRDRGIACMRLSGRVAGVEVPQTMWLSWRVKDGQLAWWASFRSEAEALEAVGLSE
jgi:ketosteroid isomerase-like protein